MAVKKFRPTTPSRREMTMASFEEITTNSPEKSLLVSLKKTGGRNAQGKITVRHHGGRARQGSIRAPQWIKGGVVFAPKPRDYRMSIPKSMRRVAMLSALTSKVQNDEMVVLDSLTLEAPKTKEIVKMLNAFDAKKTLIVTAEANETVYKSARNIEGVAVLPVNNINVYDLLKYPKVIMTKDAVSKIEEVYA